MLLYLVQHGKAKREEEDPRRGLTERGVREIRDIGTFVKKLHIGVEQIFHSGKTRARETAEELGHYLRADQGITATDGLAPLDDPAIWVKRLQERSQDCVLVGHLPHLGKLAALLLCKDREMSVIAFKNAGMVCLKRFEDGHWEVEWVVVPELVS